MEDEYVLYAKNRKAELVWFGFFFLTISIADLIFRRNLPVENLTSFLSGSCHNASEKSKMKVPKIY
jgi:hypothetical protein